MSDRPDWTPSLAPRDAPPPPAKTLQFALVMLGACVFLSLGIGILFRQVPAAPAPRLAPKAATAGAPAREAPKPVANMLQYRADASGHFFVDAQVNGTTIRFLVDTGASVVALSPEDARAAGLADGLLDFSQTINTANGQTRAAQATLRSVRLDQMEMLDVSAVVMQQTMPVSLLGMSFLRRLEGYSIHDGVLTMEW